MNVPIAGYKDAERIAAAKRGDLDLKVNSENGAMATAKPFRKTTLTYAVQMESDFTVDTLEGRHVGMAGDWLAVGAHGEMYPIDEAVFAETYEPAE